MELLIFLHFVSYQHCEKYVFYSVYVTSFYMIIVSGK